MRGIGTGFAGFVLCVGCGGGGVGKPIAQFPSNEQLQQVASRQAKPVAPLPTVDVERWQLQTLPPPLNAVGYPRENVWDQKLIDAAARRGQAARPSAELRCAAQETARFYVTHGGYPDDGLRRHLVGRCGSTLGSVGLQTVTGAVPDTTSEAELEQNLQTAVSDMLDQQLSGGGARDIGLGFARGNGRAAVVVYAGVALGRLRGFSPVVQGNSVTLTGELDTDAALALGLVNQGAYGVTFCEPDRSLKLPTFRVTCPLTEADQLTRIEIVTRKPNQVLMNLNLQALVRRSDDAGLTYEANAYGVTPPAANAAAFRAALLDRLNAARTQAGVRPLAFEANQSRTNERLVPHFFSGMFGGNEPAVEVVALGLLAGWDVGGMIRDGGIFSGVVTGSRNAGRWLTHALESPLGRWVLLEPGMSRIAVGVGGLEPSGAMALVTTYAFFETSDHRADEAAVFDELDKVRKARGLAPVRRSPQDPALQAALAKIAVNSLSSSDALKEALDRLASERQRGVAGWLLETSDLKQLAFGDTLLAAGSPEVGVGVTHYKAEGGAWGQYAVLFVIFQDGPPTQTAQQAKPKRHASPVRGKNAGHARLPAETF